MLSYLLGQNYLTISRLAGVFQTESWTDASVFTPIHDDLSIKIQSYDQFTYPADFANYFIGDSRSQYAGSVRGESEENNKTRYLASFLCRRLLVLVALYFVFCRCLIIIIFLLLCAYEIIITSCIYLKRYPLIAYIRNSVTVS